MADIKWSAFASGGGETTAATAVGFAGGVNYKYSLSSTPYASGISCWDANKNLSANNFINGYTSTPTAGATTTLTVASTYQQFFTGSTTQNVVAPVVSTLVLGFSFYIVNLSSGVLTVKSSGGNTIQAMAQNTAMLITVISTSGTDATSWDTEYSFDQVGVESLAGTANQIAFSSPTGSITATLPQAIATTSAVEFASVQFSGNNGLLDSSGNTLVAWAPQAAAVNNWLLYNNATGQPVGMNAVGTDTNIGVRFAAKGTGVFQFESTATTTALFYSGTALQHITSFAFPGTAASQTITFPDATGTVALTSQIPSVTPSALTETDDTNVTLTLGGSPTVALLAATSLTLGWTGQLGLTRGGTAASLTASNGGIVYSSASALAILSGTATATQMLQSGTSTTPAWSTTTWPATSTINQLLYSSAANTISGLATATTAVLTTSSGVPTWASELSLALGGTNAALTASNGGIFYSTASAGAILSGTATAGQLLTSGASTAPAWTTSTYPSTNAANTLLYASSANVMGALATANSSVLITSSGGVPSMATTLPAGVQTNITALGIIAQNLTLSPAAGSGSRYLILNTDNTYAGTFVLQAGGGSASYGGSIEMYGSSHATRPGYVSIGLGNQSTALFTITAGLNTSDMFAINNAGAITTGSWAATTLPVNVGGTGITSFGTGIATALGTNVNGSGAISLATSPTFVTPTLGAATATSINFGGSSLSTYVASTSWTPVATFATPGNLSVVYTGQSGSYSKIGDMITVNYYLYFTPTFTTASGEFHITGLPFAISSSGYGVCLNQTSTVVYPVGSTYLSTQASGGVSYLAIYATGSGVGGNTLTTSNLTSGGLYLLTGTVTYLTP
jgi:hypothetical protein